ncbi:MAG: hypothetical protein C0599_16890 [Salinivirgaceae bacterium]|nr:MAG: hypothetical protein C0599_16890 [Salinivirgaceae bacterium]
MKKILPILIIALVVFSGCLKRKESFLVGKWENVQRVADPVYMHIWAFKDNNTFEVESFEYLEDGSIGESVNLSVGEYTLKKKNFEFRLTLEYTEGSPLNYYNVEGEYWVEELDRDLLKITREDAPGDQHPFLRLEFIRV